MRARALKVSLVSVVAVLAAAVAGTSAASAATVTVRNDRDGSPAIYYVAGPGERNDVTLRSVPALVPADMISDSGAVIVASRGCTSIDAHNAVCPAQYILRAHIAVGDLDDRVTPAEDLSESVIIDGGPGNDVLRGTDFGRDRLNGGGGQDQLYGGRGDDTLTDGDREGAVGDAAPGPDTLDGGGGSADRLSYAGRTEAVRVRAGVSADGGEPGEHDDIRGIEDIVGGAGDDRLLGDRHGNLLSGGAGNDMLDGRGGVDLLEGGRGDDRLSGGRAFDELHGGAGVDALSCGRGNDGANAPQAGEVLPRSCERVLFRWDDDARLWVSRSYPTRTRTWWLSLSTSCPYIWSDVEVGCRGTVAVREMWGRRRLLARGSFSHRPGDPGGVSLALTTTGYRWATGLLEHASATVSVRISAEHTPKRPFKWTIRAPLPA